MLLLSSVVSFSSSIQWSLFRRASTIIILSWLFGSWRTVFPVLFNSWLFSDTITFYRLENADYFREGIIPCTIIDFTIIVAVPSTSRKQFISKLMSWCCHHSRKIGVFGQIGRTRFVRIKLSAFLCCSILLLSYCIAYYGMSVVDN